MSKRSRDNNSYVKTGRNIEMPHNYMLQETMERLRQHPDPDMRVIIRTPEGRMVEVPPEMKELAMKKIRESSINDSVPTAHTRLRRKDAYAKPDMFIMDKELRRDMNLDTDHGLHNNQINLHSKALRNHRKLVGKAKVYGGDLPRDMDLYHDVVDDDMMFPLNQKFGANPKEGQFFPDDLHDMKYPYDEQDLKFISQDIQERRENVGSSMYPIDDEYDYPGYAKVYAQQGSNRVAKKDPNELVGTDPYEHNEAIVDGKKQVEPFAPIGAFQDVMYSPDYRGPSAMDRIRQQRRDMRGYSRDDHSDCPTCDGSRYNTGRGKFADDFGGTYDGGIDRYQGIMNPNNEFYAPYSDDDSYDDLDETTRGKEVDDDDDGDVIENYSGETYYGASPMIWLLVLILLVVIFVLYKQKKDGNQFQI